MLTIDGSIGEGGGQVLRSALALSLCYGRPFQIERIRKSRPRPGLRRQHLSAVLAAAEVSGARVEGAELGSGELRFVPGKVRAGDYRFAIGSAGSTALVMQTVLPALLTTGAPSRIILEGGTHNPMAPPFEFLQRVFVPLLGRMGVDIAMALHRPGFFPKGGGCMEVAIKPTSRLTPLYLLERGRLLALSAEALLCHLPEHIARRECAVLEARLGDWRQDNTGRSRMRLSHRIRSVEADGAGNVLLVQVDSEQLSELMTAFGQRGVRAERVAEGLSADVRRYLDAGVPVGEHLADQLLLPLLLAGEGAFDTLTPSSHALTNMEVLHQFSRHRFNCRQLGPDRWRIALC